MEREPSEGGDSSGDGDREQNERELATKVVNIQAKRFYVDVKENQRGRFIKLAELAAGRRKNRIIFPMSITGEFRDRLAEFQQASDQMGPTAPVPLPEDGKLRSAVIVKDFRRYYLDLKENERGRFVRIGIPAQGIGRLREAFTELIDEFGNQEEVQEERVPFRGEMPKSRSIRVENKTFYFDIDQNQRGMFMKISEVKQNFRSSITIPERSWGKLRDTISEYMLEIRQQQQQPSPLGLPLAPSPRDIDQQTHPSPRPIGHAPGSGSGMLNMMGPGFSGGGGSGPSPRGGGGHNAGHSHGGHNNQHYNHAGNGGGRGGAGNLGL